MTNPYDKLIAACDDAIENQAEIQRLLYEQKLLLLRLLEISQKDTRIGEVTHDQP